MEVSIEVAQPPAQLERRAVGPGHHGLLRVVVHAVVAGAVQIIVGGTVASFFCVNHRRPRRVAASLF